MKQLYKYCLLGILILALNPLMASPIGYYIPTQTVSSDHIVPVQNNVIPETQVSDNMQLSQYLYSHIPYGAITIDNNYTSFLLKAYVRLLSFCEIQEKASQNFANHTRTIHVSLFEPILYYIYALEKIVI